MRISFFYNRFLFFFSVCRVIIAIHGDNDTDWMAREEETWILLVITSQTFRFSQSNRQSQWPRNKFYYFLHWDSSNRINSPPTHSHRLPGGIVISRDGHSHTALVTLRLRIANRGDFNSKQRNLLLSFPKATLTSCKQIHSFAYLFGEFTWMAISRPKGGEIHENSPSQSLLFLLLGLWHNKLQLVA